MGTFGWDGERKRDGRHADLPELLAQVDPAGCTRDEWLRAGMGLKAEGFPLEVWDDWSRRDRDRYREGECARLWDGFNGEGVTGATVAAICFERGADRAVTTLAVPPAKEKRPAATPRVNKYGFTNEEAREHHRTLIREARRTLVEDPEAQRLAGSFLATHCGMTVAEGIAAGLGVVDAETVRRAGSFTDLTAMYRDGYARLVFPARGEFDYYHIDRDISEGFEERSAKEYRDAHRRYHKYAKPSGLSQPGVLNPEALGGEVCFIVEGWPDALAVEAEGHRATPVLSTGSRGTVDAIAAVSRTHDLRAVVMLDNDTEGRRATAKMLDSLEKKKVVAVAFPWPDGAPKDAGEWRAQDREGLSRALASARKAALDAKDKWASNPIWGYPLFDEERQPRISELVGWMKNTPVLVTALKLNECSGEYWKLAPLPWDTDPTPRPWDDSRDGAALRMAVEESSNKQANRNTFRDALGVFTSYPEQRFNPLRGAILSLPKVRKNTAGGLNVREADGTEYGLAPLYDGAPTCLGSVTEAPRGMGWALADEAGNIIDNVTCVAGWTLPRFLGAEASRYTYEVESALFRAIIARALHPGCDFQLMPILFGAQGIGKDTYWKACALIPSLFVTLAQGMDEKSISSVAPGHLIADVEELAAMKSTKSIEQLKSAVSRSSDVRHVNYRGDYDLPRSFVMVGSTNARDVLRDETGNRRFPIIECGATERLSDAEREEMFRLVRIGIAEMKEEYDRMGWAEFSKRLRLPEAVLPAMERAQATFTEADDWAERIDDWLREKRPARVCINMAAREALGMEADRITAMSKPDRSRITRALDASKAYRRVGKQRVEGHGTVTAWDRQD